MNSLILLFLTLVHFSSPVWSNTHQPEEFLKKIKGSPNEGQEIVQHFCSTCHAPNPTIPLGAPQIGKESDWGQRVKKGASLLIHNTQEGINAMPPRGGCFECSDKQLALAILYMMPESIKISIINELKEFNKNI